MAPYYEGLCKDLKWQLDGDLLNKMKKANEEELKRLDDVLEDAEKNLGESEIRDAMMAKAEYLIRIGDKVTPPQDRTSMSRLSLAWACPVKCEKLSTCGCFLKSCSVLVCHSLTLWQICVMCQFGTLMCIMRVTQKSWPAYLFF